MTYVMKVNKLPQKKTTHRLQLLRLQSQVSNKVMSTLPTWLSPLFTWVNNWIIILFPTLIHFIIQELKWGIFSSEHLILSWASGGHAHSNKSCCLLTDYSTWILSLPHFPTIIFTILFPRNLIFWNILSLSLCKPVENCSVTHSCPIQLYWDSCYFT